MALRALFSMVGVQVSGIGTHPLPSPAFAHERAAAALMAPPEMPNFVQRRGVGDPGLDRHNPDLVAVGKRVTPRRASAPRINSDPMLFAHLETVVAQVLDGDCSAFVHDVSSRASTSLRPKTPASTQIHFAKQRHSQNSCVRSSL